MRNNRILIVDDNPNIHQDFDNALSHKNKNNFDKILQLEKKIFGKNTDLHTLNLNFELHHAFSADEAIAMLHKFETLNTPIALIFMDIKMPDGLDGITTSKIILEKYPTTEIVLCTAFTNYSHEEIIQNLGFSDHVLFLKKPFDIIEVRQLAIALLQKWNLNQEVMNYTSRLEEEVKKRTHELEDALIEVKKSNLAKTNFLSLMSHEFKNPIISIVGLLEFIKKTPDASEKENFLLSAHKASVSLLNLVNDILDLSKIENQQLSIENADFSIQQILEKICIDFTIPIYEKKLYFNLLISPEIPLSLSGDVSRILQILVNYMSNAVKFTLTGGITLNIEKNKKQGQDYLAFNVIDTGIGISEEDQAKIFTDYTQISDGLPYNKLGTGLGLSISRKIANLMGGEVYVKSQKNVGSTFSLELPLNSSQTNVEEKTPTKLADTINILLFTTSQTSLDFFIYYISKLKLERNFFIAKTMHETETFLLKLVQLPQKVKLFFEVANPITENLLTQCSQTFKEKVELYATAPYIHTPTTDNLTKHHVTLVKCPLSLATFLNNIYTATQPLANDTQKNKDFTLTKTPKQCKILLVDDDPTALLMTEFHFKEYGLNVDKIEDSNLVVPQHQKNQYDFIFMDLMLNGTDGIEITKKIRQMAAPYHQVYIVALTANSSSEDKKRCLDGGMNYFLSKPINPQMLYNIIVDALAPINQQINEENNLDHNEQHNEENALTSLITEYLRTKHSFKTEQILKILQTTKLALNGTLEEIEKAIATHDFSLLTILFHRIKGTLKNIGLAEAAEWAREIEISIDDQKQLDNAQVTLQRLRNYLTPLL